MRAGTVLIIDVTTSYYRLAAKRERDRMKGLIFCCGYCGQPTDKEGVPLKEVPTNFDNAKAEMVHGICCAGQAQHEQESRIVTRDMAIDAGMPEIEGMQY